MLRWLEEFGPFPNSPGRGVLRWLEEFGPLRGDTKKISTAEGRWRPAALFSIGDTFRVTVLEVPGEGCTKGVLL